MLLSYESRQHEFEISTAWFDISTAWFDISTAWFPEQNAGKCTRNKYLFEFLCNKTTYGKNISRSISVGTLFLMKKSRSNTKKHTYITE